MITTNTLPPAGLRVTGTLPRTLPEGMPYSFRLSPFAFRLLPSAFRISPFAPTQESHVHIVAFCTARVGATS